MNKNKCIFEAFESNTLLLRQRLLLLTYFLISFALDEVPKHMHIYIYLPQTQTNRIGDDKRNLCWKNSNKILSFSNAALFIDEGFPLKKFQYFCLAVFTFFLTPNSSLFSVSITSNTTELFTVSPIDLLLLACLIWNAHPSSRKICSKISVFISTTELLGHEHESFICEYILYEKKSYRYFLINILRHKFLQIINSWSKQSFKTNI